ncbi:hypothetical protein CR513_15970, partial [Mucuna pruriens]
MHWFDGIKYYVIDLYIKLPRLYQMSKSVKEYYKEIEVCLMRAQIEESQEETMARSLHGISREIQNIVEHHHYHTLEDLVHQATKVEKQLKKKFTSRKSYPKSNLKGKEKERPRKDMNLKKGSEPSQGRNKEKASPNPSSSKSSNIKCFKCFGGKVTLSPNVLI